VDLFKLVEDVRQKLATEIKLPIKVAVMGCVVNGPGECEGSDVAIFAGKGRGIIYVQGEQTQTVSEDKMLDALLDECRKFAAKVQAGQAKLTNAPVEINV
jgi:(E)-4-hydroxy-3-methylbut-2-enyl-diphosphate synthase